MAQKIDDEWMDELDSNAMFGIFRSQRYSLEDGKKDFDRTIVKDEVLVIMLDDLGNEKEV